MDRTDLAQLVSLAAKGDADAYAEIVRRYRDHVYGYCYHLTGSFEDARDLSQDAFVRAYTRLGQLREPDKLGAWLRKIAANLCARWAESRRETPVERIEPDETPRESPRAVAVREALSSLPDNERLAVVLKYVNGYSYDDIAGFLEVSTDAVRGRLHRGRKMLKAEVLKMTRETFDDNKLDEKFVIEAVRAAIAEAMDAYNLRGDKDLSRSKTDEAAALVDKVSGSKIEDPTALGRALLSVGSRELIMGDKSRAEEHWNRAKALFEHAGDQDGLAEWRSNIAYQRLGEGDLASAHRLYIEVEEHWRRRRLEQPGVVGYGFLAAARALESLGLDTNWDLVVSFMAGDCDFEREDSQTIQYGGYCLGFSKDSYPARVRTRLGPPFGPTPPPLVLIKHEPVVGDKLRFVNNENGRSEESVLESLSETVTTPAGTFTNCAHSSSRIFATKDWTADVVATRELWLAPGVGPVRIAYQTVGEAMDASELVSYHIDTPSADFVPLAIGNWWKWRWIEGEEEFGFRTEECKEIVAQEANRWACATYAFAVAAPERP